MPQFQLYRKREFNELLTDTIQFFKENWKHFLRNYLLVNGLLLLIMVGLYYSIFKNMISSQGLLLDNISSNLGLFYASVILFLLIVIIFMFTSMLYPLVYLRLMARTGGTTFQASDVLKEMQKSALKFAVFGLMSTLILLPLFLIGVLFSFILIFLIVGIPILILLFPTYFIYSFQLMYIYIEEDISFFSAMTQAYDAVKQKYWHKIGATIIIYLCVYFISFIFYIVPYVYQIIQIINSANNPSKAVMSTWVLVMYSVSMIFTYVFVNISYVNQGLIYYSSVEMEQNYQAFTEIDSIGQKENE